MASAGPHQPRRRSCSAQRAGCKSETTAISTQATAMKRSTSQTTDSQEPPPASKMAATVSSGSQNCQWANSRHRLDQGRG